MKAVRWLRGGELNNGAFLTEGPAFKQGYPTTALGWADTIEVKEGEIAVRVLRGGLWTFSGYLIGDQESVKRCLQAALNGEESSPVPFNGSWKELIDAAQYLHAHDVRKLGISA